MAKKPPKPVQHREEPPQPNQASLPSAPTPSAPAAPPQTTSAATPVPAPVPSPEASAGYRALLSAWLESHKRYPDASRQRGEEGNAVLRFEVDRGGHVIEYAVTKSSGYPDLDASVEEMMRSATLPPFPAGMPQPRMEVSVTIRFSLRR
jgi:protein TonB